MIEKKIIGRKDIADFPKLDLKKIAIKIDTGAYTSSIHCNQIEEIFIHGKKAIRFSLLDPGHDKYNNKTFVIENYKQKRIKSSNGSIEERFVIYSEIKLFGDIYPIELSLSERETMKYPVLIGRKILKKRFIVDPAKVNLSYRYEIANRKTINPENK